MPTCIAPGSYVEICATCQKTQKTALAATDVHRWDGGTLIEEATETTSGEIRYTCLLCAETKSEAANLSEYPNLAVSFENKTVEFTGKPVDESKYMAYVSGISDKGTYSFFDSNGTLLPEPPTNVGVYVMKLDLFSSQMASAYKQPDPQIAVLVITPAKAQDIKRFGIRGLDTPSVWVNDGDEMEYYYDEMAHKFFVSDLPAGLSFSCEMRKIKDENGRLLTVPQPIPNDPHTGLASVTDVGTYKLTVCFTDSSGNYIVDSYPPQTVTLTIKHYPNQVLFFTPKIDGKADTEYFASAQFRTVFDFDDLAEDEFVIGKVSEASSRVSFGATAEIYYLWDGDYVYICVIVEDSTCFSRSDEYLAQPNPWLNDCIEIYYHLGGKDRPTIQTTVLYPTYSCFTTDSLGRGGFYTGNAALPSGKSLIFKNAAAISAIPQQRSAYFKDILCATSRSEAEEGEGYTYIVEMAIPAKSELVRGPLQGEMVDGELLYKKPGEAIVAGDYGYFSLQINDLAQAVPTSIGPQPAGDKYSDVRCRFYNPGWEEYEKAAAPYVSSYSNRYPENHMCVKFTSIAP